MSEAILNQIIEAEKEALQIEEDSRREARELVAKARQEAAAILEKGRLEGEARRAEILKQTCQELEAEAKSREEAVEKAALELERSAEQKVDSAVQYILGRIVDISGSR